MYRRAAPRSLTKREMSLFLFTVKKGLHDEPSKYQKYLNILKDYKAFRIDIADVLVRMEEVLQDYPKLLLGFAVFISDTCIPDDPSESNKGLGQFKTMVGKRVLSPVPTLDTALEYVISIEEAFYDDPAKYGEFLKIIFTAQRVNEATLIAKVESITRDHPNLLMGFRVFLSASTPRLSNKRKRAESNGAKRKTRSQRNTAAKN